MCVKVKNKEEIHFQKLIIIEVTYLHINKTEKTLTNLTIEG